MNIYMYLYLYIYIFKPLYKIPSNKYKRNKENRKSLLEHH